MVRIMPKPINIFPANDAIFNAEPRPNLRRWTL
jgi:hypothetical protein